MLSSIAWKPSRYRPPTPGPHPGDASCQKTPPDASPISVPQAQPTEKEHLKIRCLKTSHTGQTCVTRLLCAAGPEKPLPGSRTRAILSSIPWQPRCYRPPSPGPRNTTPLPPTPPTSGCCDSHPYAVGIRNSRFGRASRNALRAGDRAMRRVFGFASPSLQSPQVRSDLSVHAGARPIASRG